MNPILQGTVLTKEGIFRTRGKNQIGPTKVLRVGSPGSINDISRCCLLEVLQPRNIGTPKKGSGDKPKKGTRVQGGHAAVALEDLLVRQADPSNRPLRGEEYFAHLMAAINPDIELLHLAVKGLA
jgi:hypothetical protein